MNEQIEAIRAEIERRKEKHWDLLPDADSPEDDWTHNEFAELGAYKELEHLETFVDSLPEETDNEEPNCPKLSDTLEEAAEESMPEEEGFLEVDIYGGSEAVYSKEQMLAMYKAGAEWQKEQMMDEWLKDRDGCFWDGVEEGKKAMKEQMMKDAVEGYVNYYEDSGGILMAEAQVGCPYHVGDKVKIIIVKEDER